jgi:hypothetical protein
MLNLPVMEVAEGNAVGMVISRMDDSGKLSRCLVAVPYGAVVQWRNLSGNRSC